MSHNPLYRSELRRHLDDLLRTDSDLNAFCIDYFPEVHRRFTGGMERTDKVNLLFQLAPEPDTILDKLDAYSAAPRKNRLFSRVALPLMMAVAFALAAGIYACFLRHSEPSPESPGSPTTTPAADLACFPAAPLGANSGNVIDRSPDAEIYNRARLPAQRPPASMNSGNRIQGSRGAKMDNRVTETP